MSIPNQKLLLKFKDDTLATVSRASVKVMAKRLGFNETQVMHYALARLRDELAVKPERATPTTGRGSDEEYPPLTANQLAVVRKHAPRRRGKPLTSDSLF
jgi:hypothetical protein